MSRSQTLGRSQYLLMAFILSIAGILPLAISRKASAYGLLTSREIKISSSVSAATDVTYRVAATTPSTQNLGSMAIEFCSNTPVIGDACTAPSGFDINEAGLALANQAGITDWSIDATTTTNVLVLNRVASASFTSGGFCVVLGAGGGAEGVTHPSTSNTSFYARILTFTDIDDDGNGCATSDDWAGCYVSVANSDQSQHAGGIALSTAAQITVTSKVQERLVFCVYTTGAGNNCTAKSGTAITLGDTNGVLDPTGPYVDKNAKYSITTNASGNAIVRVKGATLVSGANSIDAINGGTAEDASAFGTEQFGFCNYQSAGSGMTFGPDNDWNVSEGGADDCSTTTQTAGTGSTGGIGANSDSQFAYITSELTSTYGSTISTKPAGDYSTSTLAFLGNISNTTEAGIYTTTLTFIATGTYSRK